MTPHISSRHELNLFISCEIWFCFRKYRFATNFCDSNANITCLSEFSETGFETCLFWWLNPKSVLESAAQFYWRQVFWSCFCKRLSCYQGSASSISFIAQLIYFISLGTKFDTISSSPVTQPWMRKKKTDSAGRVTSKTKHLHKILKLLRKLILLDQNILHPQIDSFSIFDFVSPENFHIFKSSERWVCIDSWHSLYYLTNDSQFLRQPWG